MKHCRYYGPRIEKDFVVLAKGFRPFATDSFDEALRDAEIKATVSSFVSIKDINDMIVWKSRLTTAVFHRP